MVVRVLAVCALTLMFSCGGDDSGDDEPTVDAQVGTVDGSSSGIDSGNGTQGPNQFCEILQEGGPYCIDGLDCCGDGVCREATDCSDSPGYLPCNKGDDCPNAFLCCQIPAQTFCTKQSACNLYNGTVLP